MAFLPRNYTIFNLAEQVEGTVKSGMLAKCTK